MQDIARNPGVFARNGIIERENPMEVLPFVVYVEQTVSVLFGTAGAKKNVFASQIKRRDYFAPAGATRGAAPSPRKLLKKFDQNFPSV